MSRASNRGFTLIEVLVALAIFAIMSGIAFRGLGTVLDARERIVDDNRKWRAVAMSFAIIERDLAAAANRPARSSDDLPLPPFAGNAPELRREMAALEFSRMGDDGTPARRVAYRLNGSTLELLAYPAIDAAPRDEAQSYALLSGVRSLETNFLDASGAWQPRWPVIGGSKLASAREQPLPRAVALAVKLESGEELTRVFALP
jgi:general secretion pathway protein J